MLKNIFAIFKNDIKIISSKIRTTVIIIGLILLPSVYAWPNILASWDPYSNTNQIKVAVISEDEGVNVKNKEINIGSSLIENLKNNNKLLWIFTKNRFDAEDGVRRGDYYASIVIPKDFSKKLVSVSKGVPEKASIDYTVNEKINAISPKITNSGASSVVNTINKNFVENANGLIFAKFHELGIKFENNLPNIEKFKDIVFKINDNFSKYEETLSEVILKVENGNLLIQKASNMLPELDSTINKGILLADKTGVVINNLENFNKNLIPTIDNHIKNIENVAVYSTEVVKYLQKNPKSIEDINSKLLILNSRLNSINTRLENIKEILIYFNELSENNLFQSEIDKVDNLFLVNKDFIDINNKIISGLEIYEKNRDIYLEKFLEKQNSFVDKLNTFQVVLSDKVYPNIYKILEGGKFYSKNLGILLQDVSDDVPFINEKLNLASYKADNIYNKLLNLNSELPLMKSKIGLLASKIKELEENFDFEKAFKLLSVDYKKQAEFFANPVELKENKLYHLKNYGTAMTPFYTALAIWVGCLLMSSLLSTKVVCNKGYSYVEMYFGRGILFFIISLLQTLVIVLGNIYFLGVEVSSNLLFVFYAFLVSLSFCGIVYTVVSVFGNVGKAICIVLLVIQMGASGATFPIQMTSKFFQVLYPKIPFTYAVSILREAIGGVYLPVVYKDIKMLVFYLGLSIIIGVLVKVYVQKLPLKQDEEKSNIFL